MKLMSNGMRGMPEMLYYRQMFAKASEVIFHLCDELSTGAESNELQKEKNEGEKEKRDIPPTPYRAKRKRGRRKERLCVCLACARVRKPCA